MKDDKKEFVFEKFMNDIQKREESARKKVQEHQECENENPNREYNRLYRERWQNRIKYRR
tara:strand:- start:566 stop:745 length:180 start_codon:yes stop_codon:yes gene_type:complete